MTEHINKKPAQSCTKESGGELFADVALDVETSALKDRLFTYKVPLALIDEAFIGAQVLVPFGPNQMLSGYIISLKDQIDSGISIKEIAQVIEPEPLFDKAYVDFLYWLADYYCASLSDVISAAIPTIFAPRVKKLVKLCLDVVESSVRDHAAIAIISSLKETRKQSLTLAALKQRCRRRCDINNYQFYRAFNFLRQEGFIRTGDEREKAQSPKVISTIIWAGLEPDSSRQRAIVAILKKNGGQMSLKSFVKAAGTTHATIKTLERIGAISIAQQEEIRDPLAGAKNNHIAKPAVCLTDEQENVFSALKKALITKLGSDYKSAENEVPWLVHGVTGSGKTEVYLRLIEEALALKRTALMLVPEISLTPQLAKRLIDRFSDRVAIWHSALSKGEKYDTWRRLRTGEVKVLLGARSASLVNLSDLGLIILDEEHDGSYKQTSPSPRYHAKDLAIERAKRCGALVVCGSATPDVASYKQAKESNRLLSMPNRVHKRALPAIEIVDMRQEFLSGNGGIFSQKLLDYLSGCLSRKEQAILLINRRGYASYVFCKACGHVARCRNCSVSLVLHQRLRQDCNGAKVMAKSENEYLACHHCGFRTACFVECPVCRSPFMQQFGLGTQRIEQVVRELFPQAKLLRLDSDVAAHKNATAKILHEFAEGHADILIGTQIVSKGLDIANVTLVGVIAADAAFNLPDYRSMERGYQLLTQVSGRAGRGERTGQVVLQTYNPEMPALKLAQAHDYESFVNDELAARKTFFYPPFSQLIRLVISGSDLSLVESASDRLAEELGAYLEELIPCSDLQILGPAPCLIERLREKFRYQFLIKNRAGEIGRKIITDFLRNKRLADGLVLAVDVDALDLM